ncbi:MAG: substrate-binding domain-containing protein [Eubacteriales bacterium]|nr:substrate-binding domain-containing protein [Eubacteriales bacterium]
MRKGMAGITVFLCAALLSGCSQEDGVRTDGYEYLIGVSLTNVMEPWLNNLVQVISARGEEGGVNLIFRDAAGSTEKQIQDIQALMECGVDLLILSPDGSDSLNDVMEEVFEEIPVVVVGVEPGSQAYTTVIQADDEGIGKMAGEYIFDELYSEGDKIVVIQGVDGSPISSSRLKGFQEAAEGKIPPEQITYHYGEWLRDVAEQRMKDFLVVYGKPDVVFAFNDEMAYGACLACEQLRLDDGVSFIGVDGFEGEIAGLNLVEKGILDATIQSPDFGGLAYDTALEILKGNKVERNITIVPKLISAEES